MEHIGEDETAFSVRIDDFDCLSRHRLNDVAGTLCFTVGHVLDQTDGTDCVDLGFPRGQRVHEADDASRSRHVALHVLHILRGLDRDSAAIEADALANECNGIGATLTAIPAHDDKPGFMRRTLSHTEQCTHSKLTHRGGVEHLDDHAELAESSCAAGEFAGVKHVPWLIDEIAGEHDAVTERCAARPRLLR